MIEREVDGGNPRAQLIGTNVQLIDFQLALWGLVWGLKRTPAATGVLKQLVKVRPWRRERNWDPTFSVCNPPIEAGRGTRHGARCIEGRIFTRFCGGLP